MSLAVVHSRTLDALNAPAVTVEVHMANGLPSFTLVGLADLEVKEARERVRAALLNSGLEFPHNKRITVSLAPADLPKESGRFDLPIALGILAAAGHFPPDALTGHEFAGELSLAGDLRPVRGTLALALAVRRMGIRRTLVLPEANAGEAALVDGLAIRGAAHLLDVVQAFMPNGLDGDHAGLVTPVPLPAQPPDPVPDLRDVRGQTAAKRALEVAAAGGHSMLLVGPPGTGKSMLAQRLPGLLPALTLEEALESAAVVSLSGGDAARAWGRRVFRTPHHSASSVALVGGGSPPRAGEVSLAHEGVLFLDELPEFSRAALEALREPLESGRITVSRATRSAEFPARFQLVAAMNPCPCGHLGSGVRSCRCTPEAVARYQGRLSGPLLDRIDLQVDVPAIDPQCLADAPTGETSAMVALRVAAARARQLARQHGLNAALSGDALDAHAGLGPAALTLLQTAARKLDWSARGYHRILRVARTVADLRAAVTVGVDDVAEAIQYRRVLVVR